MIRPAELDPELASSKDWGPDAWVNHFLEAALPSDGAPAAVGNSQLEAKRLTDSQLAGAAWVAKAER